MNIFFKTINYKALSHQMMTLVQKPDKFASSWASSSQDYMPREAWSVNIVVTWHYIPFQLQQQSGQRRLAMTKWFEKLLFLVGRTCTECKLGVHTCHHVDETFETLATVTRIRAARRKIPAVKCQPRPLTDTQMEMWAHKSCVDIRIQMASKTNVFS